jgi:hypothetical protein
MAIRHAGRPAIRKVQLTPSLSRRLRCSRVVLSRRTCAQNARKGKNRHDNHKVRGLLIQIMKNMLDEWRSMVRGQLANGDRSLGLVGIRRPAWG